MITWTVGATEYLDSYVERLPAGVTGDAVAGRAAQRESIRAAVEASAPGGVVTREHLLLTLAELSLAAQMPQGGPALGQASASTPEPPPLPPRVTVIPPRPAVSGGRGNPDFARGCVMALAGAAVTLGVIAIAGIAAAILLPALARGRSEAGKASCASNLKQIGVILSMYSREHGTIRPCRRNGEDSWLPRHR